MVFSLHQKSMAFGSWIKKIGKKIKQGFKDFANGFKHGFNKTKSILEKVPVIGNVAKILPKFNNKNNPVTKHFGSDGYVQFDSNGNLVGT